MEVGTYREIKETRNKEAYEFGRPFNDEGGKSVA